MVTNGTNGLSKKRERTAEKIITALGATRGLLTMAARKAGVSYTTVKRYATEFPSVKQAVEEAKESMLDYTEGQLFKKISDGDTASIIFYLKTQGKRRGYIERQEVTGKDGEALHPKTMRLYLSDGTVIKPPRNGHQAAEVLSGGNGHSEN